MIQPLARSYGAQVKDHLREAIMTGALQPGDRINEVRLSADLGISRTPLREAVTSLAAEGWIEQTPHRGSRVAVFDAERTRELVRVRAILETGALSLIFERDDVPGVADRLAEVAGNAGAALATRAFSLDPASDFHLCLLDASGNGQLAELGASVHAKLRVVRFRSGTHEKRRDVAMAEHDQIIDAIRAGDHDRADAALRLHLSNAAEGFAPLDS